MRNRAERKSTMLKTFWFPVAMAGVGLVMLATLSFLVLKGVERTYEYIQGNDVTVEVKIESKSK